MRLPSSESASAKPMLIPAPRLAASPTRKVSQLFPVAKAAANKGAIIPVNAIPNKNQLEILWFRANNAATAAGYRCISPDLPWGAHSIPLNSDTDLTLPGMARIVADFLAALDLTDVVIVANDTGGAVAQALVGCHPDRISRLVLTSCDAFEKFPPTPQKYLELIARSRLLTWL